jgi:hypothetical protein
MPRIATRFHGPDHLTTTATTKLTVAANEKAIIRHIHVSNPSGGAVTLTMSIGADTTATRIFDAYSIAAGSVFDHYPMYVLEETEIMQAFAGTANVLTLTIDGERSVLG